MACNLLPVPMYQVTVFVASRLCRSSVDGPTVFAQRQRTIPPNQFICSIPGLIPNFPIADNMSEIALAIRNRSEGFCTQDPGGYIAYGDPAVYIFGRPGSQNGTSALLAFPRPACYGLLYGPIEFASPKGVRLGLFCQAVLATVGKPRADCGRCIPACHGGRGHGFDPDFEDEGDIGGNLQ